MKPQFLAFGLLLCVIGCNFSSKGKRPKISNSQAVEDWVEEWSPQRLGQGYTILNPSKPATSHPTHRSRRHARVPDCLPYVSTPSLPLLNMNDASCWNSDDGEGPTEEDKLPTGADAASPPPLSAVTWDALGNYSCPVGKMCQTPTAKEIAAHATSSLASIDCRHPGEHCREGGVLWDFNFSSSPNPWQIVTPSDHGCLLPFVYVKEAKRCEVTLTFYEGGQAISKFSCEMLAVVPAAGQPVKTAQLICSYAPKGQQTP